MMLFFSGFWREVVVDFVGLFFFGDYIMVVIDEFSCFLEVEIFILILVKVVIFKFDVIFLR